MGLDPVLVYAYATQAPQPLLSVAFLVAFSSHGSVRTAGPAQALLSAARLSTFKVEHFLVEVFESLK